MDVELNENQHTASSANETTFQESVTSPPSYDEICGAHGGVPSQSHQQRSPDVAINVDARFAPSCAPALTNEQIVDSVIERSKRMHRNQWLRLYIGCVPTLLLTAIHWISWTAVDCSSTYGNDCSAWNLLYYFGIAVTCITGVILCWASYYGCTRYSNGDRFDGLKRNVRCVIKVEGNHWTSYVNYLYGPNRAGFQYLGLVGSLSFCCRQSHHKQLIERGYGYIILCKTGFILDEIYHVVRNEPHIILRVLYIVGMGLRVHLVRSDGTYTVNRHWSEAMRREAALRAVNQQTETLDIYLPQTMPENALLLLALQVQHGL